MTNLHRYLYPELGIYHTEHKIYTDYWRDRSVTPPSLDTSLHLSQAVEELFQNITILFMSYSLFQYDH